MTKAKYVDGFVLAVKQKDVKAYIKLAKEASRVWRKFGAIEYMECMGQDLIPKGGMGMGMVTYPKLLKLKKGEVVWYSFITYKSRKHRDEVNKKVMTYFQKKYKGKMEAAMPFDPRRMSYGGFTVEVGA
ncbi:MAG: DUF1428 domain-containing protein [Patescibacteria group bacterium]